MVQSKELRVLNEDELIIQGLLFDEYKAYDMSRRVFGKLYDMTGAKSYLFKEVTASLMSGSHISESIQRLKSWDEKNPDTLEVRRLLIPLYLTNKQIQEAKTEAEFLLERSKRPKDLDLASNPYLYSGEFKKALELLEKVYAQTSSEDVLLRMATIMDELTGERKKAIQLLETHRRMNIVSKDIYFKLLALYFKENDVDGLIDIYKTLYEEEQDEKYLSKILEAYAYKGDLDGAIAFLEKNRKADATLYELYKRKKRLDKAYTLIDRLYAEKKDPRWLAEKAMLLFEKSKDKNDRAMLKEVIGYFEKAVKEGVDDSIYLNYYGYTLIEKEIDVKKGIAIIKEALKQQPDNTYYLDSLAWGYYKEKQCDKAYELMQRVVKEEGLKEKEIKEHWEKIRKCR
jgi:tetratricopeptide (TPR) repeat protein